MNENFLRKIFCGAPSEFRGVFTSIIRKILLFLIPTEFVYLISVDIISLDSRLINRFSSFEKTKILPEKNSIQ